MASKPTGKPNGRPTKYDPKIHPGIVKKLAATGMTEEDMADVLEISRPTFLTWKNTHEEFLSAVVEGKSTPLTAVEAALYRLCKGYTYDEGGVKRTKHPDVRAIQFYLKNVAPDKWRDKQEVEHSGEIKGPLVIIRGPGKGEGK